MARSKRATRRRTRGASGRDWCPFSVHRQTAPATGRIPERPCAVSIEATPTNSAQRSLGDRVTIVFDDACTNMRLIDPERLRCAASARRCMKQHVGHDHRPVSRTSRPCSVAHCSSFVHPSFDLHRPRSRMIGLGHPERWSQWRAVHSGNSAAIWHDSKTRSYTRRDSAIQPAKARSIAARTERHVSTTLDKTNGHTAGILWRSAVVGVISVRRSTGLPTS